MTQHLSWDPQQLPTAERGQDGAPTHQAGGPECIKKDGVPHTGWKTQQIISQTSDSPSLGANYTPLQTQAFSAAS